MCFTSPAVGAGTALAGPCPNRARLRGVGSDGRCRRCCVGSEGRCGHCCVGGSGCGGLIHIQDVVNFLDDAALPLVLNCDEDLEAEEAMRSETAEAVGSSQQTWRCLPCKLG